MAMRRGEEAVAVGDLGADLDQSGHFDAKENARSPGTYYTQSRHLEKNALPRLGENLVAIKTEVSAPGVGKVVLTMLTALRHHAQRPHRPPQTLNTP
jgi:hypothetical protein